MKKLFTSVLRNSVAKLLVCFAFSIFIFQNTYAQATFTSTGVTSDWNISTTWTITGTDDDAPTNIPDGDDIVIIAGGHTVIVDAPSAASSVTLNATGAGRTLTINANLTVTGNVLLDNAGTSGNTNQITVGSNTLIIGGALSINGGPMTRKGILSIGSGLVDVAGNVTLDTDSDAEINFTTGQLEIGGVFTRGAGSTFTVGSGTVVYDGGAQSIVALTYYNLILSGSGVKTASGALTATSLDNGGLLDDAITLNMAGNALSATTIDNTGATIRFSGAANGQAIPTGTVEYFGGTQNIATGTYATLNITNTGTKTALGAITATTLDNGGPTNVAAILNMVAYTLTATTIDNTGATIRFFGANGLAIATGTIEYFGTTQSVTSGSYATLNITATGTKTASGNISATTILDNGGPSNVAAILDMVAYTLTSPSIQNTGATIRFSGNTNGKAIGTGTVEYFGGAAQIITSGTYATLNITVTGTKTASGNISATTALDNGGSSNAAAILNMAGYTLSAATIDNTGATIQFSGGPGLAIATGTVEYFGGAQAIAGGSYATLNITVAGAKTASGAISATTLDNGGASDVASILDMAGFNLTAASLDNTGTTIRFSGIANGKAISTGTVEYYGGTQTIANGTYASLQITTAGTKTAAGTIIATTLDNGGALDAAAILDMGVNALVATSMDNTGATVRFSGANGLAISTGAVEYYGTSQSVTAGNYNDLIINQAGGVAVIGGDIDVNGTLNLAARNLRLGSNTLTVSALTVASPSATNMIIASGSGQLRKLFTAAGSFTFPVGDDTGVTEYSPIVIDASSAIGFSPTAYIGVSVVDAKHPSNASTSHFLTRYWNLKSSEISGPVSVSGTYTSSASDITGTEASIKPAQLTGTFNQATNPWTKDATALSGSPFTMPGLNLTSGQTTFITGITSAGPTVTNDGGDIPICFGASTAMLATPSGDGPFIYQWSSVPASGGLSSATIANPTATPTATTDYTVIVTDANGIVSSVSNTRKITVDPLPTLATVSQAAPVCDGTIPTINLTGLLPGATLTVDYSINAIAQTPVTGVVVDGSGNASFAIPALTFANNGQSLLITALTVPSTTCSQSFSQSTTLSVNPIPVLSSTLTPAAICSGTTLVYIPTSPTSGSTFSWTSAAVGNITGNSASGSGTIVDVLTNTGNAVEIVTYEYTVSANGCTNPITYDVVVTVYPSPVEVITNNELIVCEGTGVDIDYSTATAGGSISVQAVYPLGITGGTYAGLTVLGVSGTVTEVLGNTSSSSKSVVYTFTVSRAGCTSVQSSTSVVVDPLPVFTGTPYTSAICSGTALGFTPTSDVSGSTFSWTSAAVGNITGNSVSGSGTIVDVLTNTGNAVEMVTYVLTVTGPSPEGCVNVATTNYVVTVYPSPVEVITNNELIVCEGTGVDIDYSTATAGGSISVQAVYPLGITGGTYAGLTVLGVSGTVTEVLGNTSSSSKSVVYTFTVSRAGCTSVQSSTSVVVDPLPVFTGTPYTSAICSGTALGFTPTSDVSGSTFSWTSAAVGNITGNSASGSGTIVDVLTNTGNAVEMVTYVLTVTGPSPEGCVNVATTNYVVTVYPSPVEVITNNELIVCEGTGVDIDYSTATAGGSISVQAVYPLGITGGTYAGLTVLGVSGTVTEVLGNTSSSSKSVVYTFTVSRAGCTSVQSSTSVVVDPLPVFTGTPYTSAICSGTALGFTPTSDVSGSTFSWTSAAVGNITGNSVSGSGTIVDVLTNTGNAVEMVTYVLTVTGPSPEGCVNVATTNYVVTVYPSPVEVITNNELIVCEGTGVDIDYSTSTAGGSISVQAVYPLGITGGTYAGLTVLGVSGTVTEVLGNTSSSSKSVVYTFTVSRAGCTSVQSSTSVVVDPLPVFTGTPYTSAICSGTALGFTPTSDVSGSTFSWTSAAVGNITGNSVSGSGTIVDVLTNTGNAVEMVTYVLTVTGPSPEGCVNVATTNYVVTVYPSPVEVITNNELIVCEGTGVDIDYSTSTAGGSISVQAVYPLGITGGTYAGLTVLGVSGTVTEVLGNTSSSSKSVVYTFTVSRAGCTSVQSSTSVVVDPLPVFTGTPYTSAICSGTALGFTPTSDVSGSTFSWTSAAVGNITGNSVSGSGTIVDVLTNTGNAVEMVTYVLTVTGPSPEGCVNVATTNYVVTVYPSPVEVITNNELIVCEGTGVDIDYSTATAGGSISVQAVYPLGITGGTYAGLTVLGVSGTVTEVLGNTSSSSKSVVYTFTVSRAGCTSVQSSTSVVVDPLPVFTGTPYTSAICSGTALGFTPTSDVSGSTFSWTSAAVGNITGNSASGSGTIVDVLTNTGNAVEMVTYVLTVTGPSPEGCVNVATTNYVVTVYPSPVEVITNNELIVCEGTGVDIDYSTATAGGSISVQAVYPLGITGGTYAGLTVLGVSGTVTEVLGNTSSSSKSVVYTFTVSRAGCTSVQSSTSVVVDPLPVFTGTPYTSAICSGTALGFTPTSDVSGSTFSWTSAAVGNITGNSVSGSGTIVDVLTNTGNAVEMVTYVLTVTGPSPEGCVNVATTNYVVTVYPSPVEVITNNELIVCEGTGVDIDYSTSTAGGSISVQAVYPLGITGGTYAGLTVLGVSGTVTEVLGNTSSSSKSVVYTFTVSRAGCTSVQSSTSVVVDPLPVFTGTPYTSAICSGTALGFTPTSDVSGSTFSWTSAAVGNITGNSVSGSGTIVDVLTNTGNAVEMVTYVLTVTGPSPEGCVNVATTNYVVTVYPSPVEVITNNELIVCEGTGVDIDYSTSTAGGSISVQAVYPLGITGGTYAGLTVLGVSGTVTEVLGNTSSSSKSVVYTFTVSRAGCTSVQSSTSVVVDPLPVFTGTPYTSAICSGTALGFTPTSDVSGSTFSWTSAAVGNITGNSVSGSGTIVDVLTNTGNAVEMVTYVLTVTGPSPEGCVNVATTNYVVTVYPSPVEVITNNELIVCEGTGVDIDYSTSTAGGSISVQAVYPLGITGGTYAGLTVLGVSGTVTEVLGNTSSSSKSVVYTFTVSRAGCTSVQSSTSVVVDPLPVFTGTPYTSAICSGTALGFTPTSDVSGSTFSWTSAAVGNITGNSVSGSGTIVDVLTNTGNAVEMVTYVLTVTGPSPEGCVNVATTNYVVTVYPSPVEVITNNELIVCEGTGVDIDYSTSTAGGSISVQAVYPLGITGGTYAGLTVLGVSGTVTEVLGNTSSSSKSVVYTFTVSRAGCTSVQSSTSVVVDPLPVVSSATTRTICSGVALNYTTVSDVSGTTYTWVATLQSGTVSGFNSNATPGNGSITDILTNSGTVLGVVRYVITPSANGCTGAAFNLDVTVDPIPVITNTPLTQMICGSGVAAFTPTISVIGSDYSWDAITLSGTVTGVTSGTVANSPINDNLSNISSTVAIVRYRITPVGPGATACIGNFVDYIVTVNPIPNVLASDQNICDGSSTNILITNPNGVAGTTFTWTIGIVTGTVTGQTPDTGNFIAQTLTSSSGGSVQYIVTPSANGCAGTPTTVTVNISPIPVGNGIIAGTHVVCSGTLLAIAPTISAGAATYTWTGSNGSGGTGTINDRPTNTGSVPINITYTIIPTGPTPTFCVGLPFTIVVTVDPIPVITNAVLTETICSNSGALGFTPTISVAGSTYSWTSVISGPIDPASVTANGNNIPIMDAPINLGGTSGTITYTIVPTGPGIACPGPTVNYVVTVRAEPVGVNDVVTVCSDVSVNYNLLLNVATLGNNVGSTYSWVATDNPNPGVTGENTAPENGIGPIITDVITNLTNTDQVVLYTVIPTGTNGCVGVPFTITVTVKPEPVGVTTIASPICSGTSFGYNLQTNVNTLGNNLASNFSWIAAGNPNITGASISVKTGSIIDDVLINATTVDQTVTYTVTPVDQTGGCSGNTFTIDVVVNPKAVFSAGPDLAICVSDLSISLTGSVSFAPSGILWSGGSNNFSDPTIATPTYTLSAAELAVTSPLAVTLTMKAFGSGACADVTDQMVLTINPLPIVGFFGLPAGSPPNVAENSPSLVLSGSTPGGGGLFTISPGIGLGSTTVAGGFDRVTLDPSAATIYTGDPLTINHVTYTYTNSNGCTNSTTQNLIVNAVTNVDFAIQGATLDSFGNYELCSELGQVKLLGFPDVSTGKPPETEFTSLTPGLIIDKVGPDYFIRTNGLVSGTYDIKYTYRNFVDAISFRIRSVKIFASPVAQFSSSNNCIASDVIFTDESTINPTPFPTNIVSWQWSFGDGSSSSMQNPSKRYTTSGTYNIGLKVTTLQNCSNTSAPIPLRVGDVPEVDFKWSAICNDDDTKFGDLTDPGSVSTITAYTWDFGDGDISTGAAGMNVPLGENGGRTTGTFENPDHKYVSFGTYIAKLTVQTNDGCNNSKDNKIFILPYSTVTPLATSSYIENFEASNGGWIEEAKALSDTSWIWGLPAGQVINTAASGTKAWWTGKNNNTYFPKEKSMVNGPCFNLTQLTRPMVSLDYWVDTEINRDGAVLQYSIDGGLNWNIVGSIDPLAQDQGINWYTGLGIADNPGDQTSGGNYGWTDRSGKWLNGRFNLDMVPAAQRAQVRLRIAFASNDTNAGTFDGFAFDNFFVGDKTRNVLVEHFTNSTDNGSLIADAALEDLYQKQTIIPGRASDFRDIQYHINYPNNDPLNLDNEADPAARANYMGVSQPPATIMDGKIDGVKFKGSFTEITAIELDRRALVDPQFELALDTVATGVQNTISLILTLRANVAFNAPLIAQVALIENNVGTFENVLRKQLLGADGEAVNQSWLPNQTRTITKNDIVINVPVVNSSELTFIAYVQDKNTKEIYQSLVKVAPRKKGAIITGIEEPLVPTTLNGIKIYPNPANGTFNFSVSEYSSPGYSWKVADQRGIVLLKGDFENAMDNRKQVDVSSLSNGVYFVIISGPGKSSVYQKLVVLNRN